ncbi:molybdopterin molybdotransferase MoeA [uncultured Desulfosarcina sp.]|uniref:molybdopterin molybdotransferase MoeA n=1 Tax=uncultured Desulfosarcina sp. TaxID=218289 RepID=UPI0029C77317|nr:molybdopterin molybdotransferase MoeA [uncultured Desulfosarcina sp.]
MKKLQMGYAEALKLTLETIAPLDSEILPLAECSGRILAGERYSQVCSPSTDASLKDGYAVRSMDIEKASFQNRVPLAVIGTAAAGLPARIALSGGDAIRILTGARIPEGADAVLSEEFATSEGDRIFVFNTAEPGRNILPKGADIATGELIGSRGSRLSPGMIGIFAAAGHDVLPVYRQPNVAILATGDELVAPGQPLPAGKLYASNLEMLKAWCRRYGMQTTFSIIKDRPDLITAAIDEAISTHDAVLTSGGAWAGDRDFVARTLSVLGWKKCFHWVRMGPGKPVGFGMLRDKPVFLLPGGPPSNLTAFLQIALPGLLKLGGYGNPSLPRTMVKMDSQLTCRQIDWTEFVYGALTDGKRHPLFTPLRMSSRLKAIALAEGVVAIEEGVKSLPAGAIVSAQLLR